MDAALQADAHFNELAGVNQRSLRAKKIYQHREGTNALKGRFG
jgi:hypothetical protein